MRIASSPSTTSTGPSSETTSAIHRSDRTLRYDRFKLCDGFGQITLIDLELEPVSLREVIFCQGTRLRVAPGGAPAAAGSLRQKERLACRPSLAARRATTGLPAGVSP